MAKVTRSPERSVTFSPKAPEVRARPRENLAEDLGNLVTKPAFMFKLCELILCTVGLILLLEFDAYKSEVKWVTIIVALPSIVGYLYIIATYILIYIFDKTNSILEILQFTIGGFLNFWTGIEMIADYYTSVNMTKATLVLSCECMICGTVMVADAFREFKKLRREKREQQQQ